jgi:Rrf2 family protein
MLNNSVIHFSDAALIAVHALANLARNGERLVQTHELADELAASSHHVAKVMQRLVRSRLVKSVKGPAGGFALALPADEISFLQAIEAVDGPLEGNFCPFRTETCTPDNCIFGKELAVHAHQLIEHLARRSIASIEGDTPGGVWNRNTQSPHTRL